MPKSRSTSAQIKSCKITGNCLGIVLCYLNVILVKEVDIWFGRTDMIPSRMGHVEKSPAWIRVKKSNTKRPNCNLHPSIFTLTSYMSVAIVIIKLPIPSYQAWKTIISDILGLKYTF